MIIRGGTVVTPTSVGAFDLRITGGTISALDPPSETVAAGEPVVDAAGCFVLPGLVDPHVHVRLPADENFQPLTESLTDASVAAIHGGVTTFVTYVRASESMSAAEALRTQIDAAHHSYVDFGFNLHCRPADDLDLLVNTGREFGVAGFKTMLAYHEKNVTLREDRLLGLMEAVAAQGGVLLVHPDNPAVVELLERRERSAGLDHGSYLRSSPAVLEADGILRVTLLSRLAGTRVHFVHLSAADSLRAARWIRSGPDRDRISWETQPHYALLTNQQVLDRGQLAKIGPPLRDDDDRAAVREAIADGVVSVLSSDHAPRTTEMKLAGDILTAPHGGMCGVELLLPLAEQALGGVDERNVAALSALTATNAATVYGLHPRKGSIAVGADADVIIVPRDAATSAVSVDQLHQRSDYSLYEGLPVRLRPRTVIKAGRIVVDDGRLVGDPTGAHLRRPY